jgi:uncharacterized protein (DUF302 family)
MIVAEVLQQLADSLQQVRAALVLVTPVANLQRDMSAQHTPYYMLATCKPKELAGCSCGCTLQAER